MVFPSLCVYPQYSTRGCPRNPSLQRILHGLHHVGDRSRLSRVATDAGGRRLEPLQHLTHPLDAGLGLGEPGARRVRAVGGLLAAVHVLGQDVDLLPVAPLLDSRDVAALVQDGEGAGGGAVPDLQFPLDLADSSALLAVAGQGAEDAAVAVGRDSGGVVALGALAAGGGAGPPALA